MPAQGPNTGLTFTDGSGIERFVSTANPLPVTGGGGGGGGTADSTAAKQDIGNASLSSIDGKSTTTNTSLSSIDTKLTSQATATKQDTGNASLAALVTATTEVTASGTITTQNLVPAGVATAGSAVELIPLGRDTVSIQTVGTYTGALSLQGTIDGTVWVTLSGGAQIFNMANGASSGTIGSATQGIFQSGIGSFTRVRVTGLAAMTGSVAVTMRAVDGNGYVGIDAPIPAGANTVGAVNQAGTWTVTATPANPTSTAIESTASLNLSSVKATAGNIYTVWASNPTATPAFLKIYNKASAPVVATDTPIRTVSIPANSDVGINFGEIGYRCSLGIALALTGAIGKTDATNTVAGVQIGVAYI